jgi:N utilization substance protein A
MVTNELRGERVDVVPFSDDPVELIQNALAPARVREVHLDDSTGTATVIVSDYQLSLAIGKEGQNARLAARLTGWRIDIKSETQLEEEAAYEGQDWAEGEWVEDESGEMVWKPAEGGDAISAEAWTHAAEEQADGETASADGAVTDDASIEAQADPAPEAAEADAGADAADAGADAADAGADAEASGEPVASEPPGDGG